MTSYLRAALYYVPAVGDPLLALGNAWLGRDPESDVARTQPTLPFIQEITAQPRHYGFHATFRAPMRLLTGLDTFLKCAQGVVHDIAPFPLPDLKVAIFDGFLGLAPSEPSEHLDALARRCVADTEALRAKLTTRERAKRLRSKLTPRQAAMLENWGYPYVLDDWRFHMTLTRRLEPKEIPSAHAAAVAHFGPALAAPRLCTELAVFVEVNRAPMRNIRRLALGTSPPHQRNNRQMPR